MGESDWRKDESNETGRVGSDPTLDRASLARVLCTAAGDFESAMRGDRSAGRKSEEMVFDDGLTASTSPVSSPTSALRRGVSDLMSSSSQSSSATNIGSKAASAVAAVQQASSDARPPSHFLRSTEAWTARRVLNLVFVRRSITRVHIPARARASAIVMANLDRLSSGWGPIGSGRDR